MQFTSEQKLRNGRTVTISVSINEAELATKLLDNIARRAFRDKPSVVVGKKTSLAEGAIVAVITAVEEPASV